MGLIKKSQILGSNTLDLINNLVEIKDNSIDSSKLSFNTFEKIVDIRLYSSQQSITITGLDGNNEQPYLLLFSTKNEDSYWSRYYFFVNGDDEEYNYDTQSLLLDDTNVNSSRGDFPKLADTGPNSDLFLFAYINRGVGGYTQVVCYDIRLMGGNVCLELNAIRHNVSISNITQMEIRATRGVGIGGGTRLLLYRCRQ